MTEQEDISYHLKRELARWYPLEPHPVQHALMNDGVRFPLVPAGRRSGKTENAKRFLVEKARTIPGIYFACAPTNQQAVSIWWDDLKLLSFSSTHEKPPKETNKAIFLNNGSEIRVFGLDTPERFEGTPWAGGVIDEIGNIRPEAWEANILPALDTKDPSRPGYKAWCWLIGVPEGRNHYYDMVQDSLTGKFSNSKVYTWFSSDILDPEIIAERRRGLDPLTFRREYEASFDIAAGTIYSDWMNKPFPAGNLVTETIAPNDHIHWCHDFNFLPMSSAICVIRGSNQHPSIAVVDEIILDHSDANQVATEFLQRYQNHPQRTLYLYGDPAGRAGEKHSLASNYTIIETKLKTAGWKVERRVNFSAPSIVDRQNSVRAFILNALGNRRLLVNDKKAPTVEAGFRTVTFKRGSAFQENETREQHVTTAVGYMVSYLFPVKPPVDNKPPAPVPSYKTLKFS